MKSLNILAYMKALLSTVSSDEAEELLEAIHKDIELEKGALEQTKRQKRLKLLAELENPVITTKELAMTESTDDVFKSAVEYYLNALSETIYHTKLVGGKFVNVPVYEKGIACHRMFPSANGTVEKLAFYIYILDSTHEERPQFGEHIIPFLLDAGYDVKLTDGDRPISRATISW